jgi:hypothetical protein
LMPGVGARSTRPACTMLAIAEEGRDSPPSFGYAVSHKSLGLGGTHGGHWERLFLMEAMAA